MKKEMWERYQSFPQFRQWWTERLGQKKNNLIDIETGQPMTIEKRVILEQAKPDDLFLFFTSHNFNIVIHNTRTEGGISLCRSYIENSTFFGIADTLSESLQLLLFSYLDKVVS